MAFESALEFLKDPDGAACLQVDPTGRHRLEDAQELRSEIRDLIREGQMTEAQAEELVELTRERLAIGLYRPELRLPRAIDVL